MTAPAVDDAVRAAAQQWAEQVYASGWRPSDAASHAARTAFRQFRENRANLARERGAATCLVPPHGPGP